MTTLDAPPTATQRGPIPPARSFRRGYGHLGRP